MPAAAAAAADVNDGELAACVATLSKLKPKQLSQPRLAEVWAAGKALFSSAIVKDRFKGDDVVEFLKKQGDYRAMERRLEKLLKQVEEMHSTRVAASTTCGINGTRLQRTKEVAEHGLPALSSAAESQRIRYGGMLLDKDGRPQRKTAQAVLADGATQPDAEPEPEPELGAEPPAEASGLAAAEIGGDESSGADGGSAAVAAAVDGGADGGADDGSASGAPRAAQFSSVNELRAAFPIGSFRRVCNICKNRYEEVHGFYHQLCPPCGDFNHNKRLDTADLIGQVALLTGGRVRIGYQIALRLLRAGAECHVTSRFPQDAALRFSLEHDYKVWSGRLRLYYLELCDLSAVEAFCAMLVETLPKLDILINNAAQTLTRPAGWTDRMQRLEHAAATQLAVENTADPAVIALPQPSGPAVITLAPAPAHAQSAGAAAAEGGSDNMAADGSGGGGGIAAGQASSSVGSVVATTSNGGLIAMDESGQPLDLSGVNSWSRRIGEVSTSELLQTMAANAAAPFVIVSRLKPLLMGGNQPDEGSADDHADPDGGEDGTTADDETAAEALPLRSRACIHAGRHLSPTPTSECDRCHQTKPDCHKHRWTAPPKYSHVVNVSALEGKFHVGKKSSAHPHTNMAKAALNMMTLTVAQDFAKDHILVNCVDTGWVTDMAPLGVGAKAKTHRTHVGPPLDEEDGAARVTDPIFCHLSEGRTTTGTFFKDYRASPW